MFPLSLASAVPIRTGAVEFRLFPLDDMFIKLESVLEIFPVDGPLPPKVIKLSRLDCKDVRSITPPLSMLLETLAILSLSSAISLLLFCD